MRLNVYGDIIVDEYKRIYDYYGWNACCPADVRKAVETLEDGETLEVKINSRGGMVSAGQEMYTTLRRCDNVEIEVEGLAASAASLIAMAGKSKISPVGILMIHDVSCSGCGGNKNDLHKMADALHTYDDALAEAYALKTGHSKDAILDLMDKETYMTAKEAVDLGFIDAISDDDYTASLFGGLKITQDAIDKYNASMKIEEEKNAILDDIDSFGV